MISFNHLKSSLHRRFNWRRTSFLSFNFLLSDSDSEVIKDRCFRYTVFLNRIYCGKDTFLSYVSYDIPIIHDISSFSRSWLIWSSALFLLSYFLFLLYRLFLLLYTMSFLHKLRFLYHMSLIFFWNFMRGNDFFDLDRHLLIRSIIHSRVICWCHRLILVVHLNRVFTVFYHISCTHTLCFNLYR